MQKALIHATWIALLFFSSSACDKESRVDGTDHSSYKPQITFKTGAVQIETTTNRYQLSIEIAERKEQRDYGLMERPFLPDDAGMLFIYSEPQAPSASFWMYRTRIPLDIAFLDAEGRIVTILIMEPCKSQNPRMCQTYSPGVPYHRAIEVNRGYFAQRGIRQGDRIVLMHAGSNDRQ